jgi:hypothetical protein
MTTARPKPNKAEILKALAYLFDQADVVELRALSEQGGRKRTDAGYFDFAHWPVLADAAVRLNTQGASVYVTLNPVDPHLLSRYHNRIQQGAALTTNDSQIIRRRWLPIDVDPQRPAGTSATQEQLKQAALKATEIRKFLLAQGWPASAVAASGNGMHLLYAIDLPNDDASKKLIEGVLKALAARFDDEAVKVDRSVFNAARIWKLYGTVANKGDHTEAAPWRLSALSDQYMPDRVLVTPEQMQALLPVPVAEPAHTPRGLDFSPFNGGQPFVVEDFMQRHGLEHTKDVLDGSERFKLAECPFNPEHKNGEAAIFRKPSGALGFKCMHNSCADKKWRDVREHFEGPRVERVGTTFSGVVDADTGEIATGRVHPMSLRNALRLSARPEAVNFVVDGFIQEGVVFIAGQQGVGKTSALLPLALAQAGLHEPGYRFAPTKPERWRHVIYLTEDAAQVNRIIAAMVSRGLFTLEQAQERIHVIPATAMDAALFVQVRDEYADLFADESGVRLAPLVVADTRSACFIIESENDNAEMSELVAQLKQNFAGLPIWVMAHLSKETATRTNASTLSVRGAGSAEGDAHQVLFLVRDGDTRWLVRGKTRFESPWPELSLRSELVEVMAQDRWGDLVKTSVRWSVAEEPSQSRAELVEHSKAEREASEMAELRDEVRNAVQEACNLGHPLNREAVKAKVKKQRAAVIATIETLLTEGWLYEVVVPIKERTNPNRKAFLVNLSTEQHEAYRATGVLPRALLVVPQSWRKSPDPSVPEELGRMAA